MFSFEKKIIKWLEAHVLVLASAAVFILGILIRISLRDYITSDSASCLLPWYDIIKENGSLKGLGEQVGNYNLLYQFCIAVFTYIPLKPLYAYKIFSCIFDMALAVLMVVLVRRLFGKERKWYQLLAFSLVFLSPVVFLNSAGWGQCDSIYSFFCILTFYLLLAQRYDLAMCMYGIAFSFKLQAVFFLPFLIVFYLRKKEFSIVKFFYIPLMMIVTALPGLLQGRSVYDIFAVYKEQTYTYPSISLNYPSFWNAFYNLQRPDVQIAMMYMAVIFAACLLGLFAVWILLRKIPMSKVNCIWLAFLMTYACVLFLPSMHDRYGYVYEILALLIVLTDWKTLILLIPLYYCTFTTYGYFLLGISYSVTTLAVVNTCVFAAYCVWFWKRTLKEQEQETVR